MFHMQRTEHLNDISDHSGRPEDPHQKSYLTQHKHGTLTEYEDLTTQRIQQSKNMTHTVIL